MFPDFYAGYVDFEAAVHYLRIYRRVFSNVRVPFTFASSPLSENMEQTIFGIEEIPNLRPLRKLK